jgi:rhodanese-related sulfurtransferase
MATTTIEKRVGQAAPISPQERAQFFRVKMDAEWGPHDLKAVQEMRADEIIVLDTRDAESFAQEHIPGAVNIPTNELPPRLGELSKDKEVVTYCWSVVCHLATRASLYLAEQGYTVHELAGGIEYWKHYKMPLESGATKRS